ncbi:MAG TPA: glucokinase [Candidatus Cybelea sp.]|nr:glucokinase [Candidatus Cybelea sp.]
MTSAKSSLLLADIGGTNARFAILEDGEFRCRAVVPVADYAEPLAALRAFLAGAARDHRPTKAVIAAAGPVSDGRIAMTNAAWVIDGKAIGRSLQLTSVQVVNDFAAVALSLPALTPNDIRVVGGGSPVIDAPRAVIGPGTGFGVGALIAGRGEEINLVSEGGHATLAAANKHEDAVIQAMRDNFSHVSIERVLSGDGLVQLYRAVKLVDGIVAPDRDAPGIVAHAQAKDCAASAATLELFCAFLGSVAGDLALIFGARGGVYIGGGIVRRFADFLAQSSFRERFETKGRLRPYLSEIPSFIILNPEPAFLGLARLGRE